MQTYAAVYIHTEPHAGRMWSWLAAWLERTSIVPPEGKLNCHGGRAAVTAHDFMAPD